ncbi:S41 family peptidase [Bremerella sp. T1]|uniref:S41 family peptidase n=1 Tax=Bremerella sp. TYQ1 TaxID=3119568 RepID=UPI001CCC9AD1|nr:S41 family peptidase [Bremerella volcania]UBM35729.1 S41 family peptidase [Bremerella volcania]
MPRGNLITIVVTFIVAMICYQSAAQSRYALMFQQGLRTISEYYVRPVPDEDLFNAAMEGMTAPLDQNSGYIAPTRYSDFRRELGQEFGGIGVHVDFDEEKREMIIISPLAGAPAYEAGIQAGDIVVAIDGEELNGEDFKTSLERLHGVTGTPVTLTVLHIGEDKPVDITMTRANIMVESVMGDTHGEGGKWDFHLASNPNIGYIRVDSFGDRTADDFADALEQIGPDVEGLIIDMRGNAGGYLTAATQMVDMFLDEGDIVTTRTRNNKIREVHAATGGTTTVPKDLPVVVMVNRASASASEIFAAALQDHGRAIVVGERSYGKGTVQSIFPLDGDRRAMKITTATYWRPSGSNIHRFPDSTEEDDWGVTPDEGWELELEDETLKKVIRARRLNDIDRTNFSKPEMAEEREISEEEQELLEFEDPQLQMAVEAIEAWKP